jgi:multiple sugar transport system substrate-binding protein
VPFATDTWAMVYNTDIMAEAGIDQVPKTWDELLEASRKASCLSRRTGAGWPFRGIQA